MPRKRKHTRCSEVQKKRQGLFSTVFQKINERRLKAFKDVSEVFPYGAADDSERQAAKLFELLRELDDDGIEEVYIRAGKTSGVGLAVYNRLIRACEFRIFDADGENR